MRNPLAAAALIALAGYTDGFESVRRAICHYDYAKLNMAEFFFAECAYYALPVEQPGSGSSHSPITAVQAAEQPEILTPPPAPEPRINGAKVFGVRPGHPLLYTIAATGRRPMKFSVTDLPEGLQVDQATGQITGSLAQRGTYRVTLRAENALGHAEARTADRRGRRHPAHAAAGLQYVGRLGAAGHGRQPPCGRPGDGRLRPDPARLAVRQHRRRLAGTAWRSAPSHPAQREVRRHAGPV